MKKVVFYLVIIVLGLSLSSIVSCEKESDTQEQVKQTQMKSVYVSGDEDIDPGMAGGQPCREHITVNFKNGSYFKLSRPCTGFTDYCGFWDIDGFGSGDPYPFAKPIEEVKIRITHPTPGSYNIFEI